MQIRKRKETFLVNKLKMQIRPLCPELAEKARVELNEDSQRIASDVQHIKDWLAKQPHLRARSGKSTI